MWDTLWTNARLATMTAGGAPYGALEPAALAAEAGRIAWLGPMAGLPGRPGALARSVVDAGGRWITPGLIDCHTHLVHAGDRAREFEMRLEGATYEEIARAGGGIRATVRATRAATQEELVAQADRRLAALCAEGVTVVEVKSGYGLDLENELKMLRAARALEAGRPVTVRTSFLGAHAVPPEFEGRADAYIEEVCDRMLPAVAAAGLADAVDAFCESIAFTPGQTGRVFEAVPCWRRATARCPPTIWSICRRRGRRPWPPPEPWRCCCRVPSTICARRFGPPSRPCAGTACRWPWRPTATPAPRRSPRC